MLIESLKVASRTLWAHRVRSLLTTLGIAIGTASVVVVVALGTGARSRIEAEINNIGNNLLFIFARSAARSGVRGAGNSLTDADAHALRTEASAIESVAVWSQVKARVFSSSASHRTSVMGVDRWYFQARGFSVAEGREIGEEDERLRSKVAIIGKTVEQELFGQESALGQWLKIGRHSYRVIGVLAEKGRSSFEDQDDRVLLPMGSFRARVAPATGGRVQLIMASARSIAHTAQAMRQAEVILRERHRMDEGEPNDFDIRSQESFRQAQGEMLDLVTLLLTTSAAIALFIGGVGVMNIMLVAVAERKREIGVRMGVGAQPRMILQQFLAEALILALFGGALGVSFAVGVSWLLGLILGWSLTLQMPALLIAIGTSLVVGLVFGALPARRAAQLDPIEALR
ncbi:MAG: ABC transporter permease [Polyangiaceae bacterium]|nr:ABC transporter permease [Polyangiaceae bacterium]